MRKYIIFQADEDAKEAEHWKLQHTQAMTWILAEYWDSSDRPIPEPGYRPTDFVRVADEHDPNKHGWSTHHKIGDWEVDKVEVFSPELPVGNNFDMVVICYCKYAPINAPLKPMPDRIIPKVAITV